MPQARGLFPLITSGTSTSRIYFPPPCCHHLSIQNLTKIAQNHPRALCSLSLVHETKGRSSAGVWCHSRQSPTGVKKKDKPAHIFTIWCVSLRRSRLHGEHSVPSVLLWHWSPWRLLCQPVNTAPLWDSDTRLESGQGNVSLSDLLTHTVCSQRTSVI